MNVGEHTNDTQGAAQAEDTRLVSEMPGGWRLFACPACNAHHVFDPSAPGITFHDHPSEPWLTGGTWVVRGVVCDARLAGGRVVYSEKSGHAMRGKSVEMRPFHMTTI